MNEIIGGIIMMKIYRHKKRGYTFKNNHQLLIDVFTFNEPVEVEMDDETKAILMQMGVKVSELESGKEVSLDTSVDFDAESSLIIQREVEASKWSRIPPEINMDISDAELKELGYPKFREPITDTIVTDDGVSRVFLNPEKWLERIKMDWLLKFTSVDLWDKITFDRPYFNQIAQDDFDRTQLYNDVSSKSQYLMDEEDKRKRMVYKGGSGLVSFILVFLIVFPGAMYSSANKNLAKGEFKKAQTQYKLAFTKSGSSNYATYASALADASESNYESAIKKMESLASQQGSLTVSVAKGLNEVKYQQAIEAYKDKEYKKAMDVFESIGMYGNAETYYNESGYALGESRYEEGDLIGAIDSFYKVRGHLDATDRAKQLSEQLYSKGYGNVPGWRL